MNDQNPSGARPEDIVAIYYQKEKNSLAHLLRTMSAKQLRRMIMFVGSYPELAAGDHVRTLEEKRSAELFHNMMMHKCVLILGQEHARAVDALEQQKEESKEDGEKTS